MSKQNKKGEVKNKDEEKERDRKTRKKPPMTHIFQLKNDSPR